MTGAPTDAMLNASAWHGVGTNRATTQGVNMSESTISQPPGWAVQAAEDQLSFEVDEPSWEIVATRAWEIVEADDPEALT